jgi:hypothetical protein
VGTLDAEATLATLVVAVTKLATVKSSDDATRRFLEPSETRGHFSSDQRIFTMVMRSDALYGAGRTVS